MEEKPVNHRLPFAIPLVLILGGLSSLHAYWAMGGRWGSAHTVPVANGRPTISPSPRATWIVSALLGFATILVIGKAGWIGTESLGWLFDAGMWGLSLTFLARTVGDLRPFGFFKKITGTPFARWDTWLYTPLCLLIALLAAGLAR